MGARAKPSTILLLDGDLKLYKRAGIRRWQATFKLKSRWVRVSTGHHDMAEAIISARERVDLGKADGRWAVSPYAGGDL